MRNTPRPSSASGGIYAAITAAHLLATAALAQVPMRWEADASAARAAEFHVYRGETARLEPYFTEYGRPVDTNGYTFTLYWQTNGMDNAWWQSPDAFTWSPSMDSGAARHTFFILASSAGLRNYRANGILKMLESPGSEPNRLPFPVQTIDFAQVSFTNAPWLTNELDAAALLALAEYAATNKVTRWQDAANPDIWWESCGGTSLVAHVAHFRPTTWEFSIPSMTDYQPIPPGTYIWTTLPDTVTEFGDRVYHYDDSGTVRVSVRGGEGGTVSSVTFSAPETALYIEYSNRDSITAVQTDFPNSPRDRWFFETPYSHTVEYVSFRRTHLGADPIITSVVYDLTKIGLVKSVNGKTGDVSLTASDLGAATLADIAALSSTLYAPTGSFSVDAGMGIAFTQRVGGYILTTSSMTATNTSHFAQGYIPAYLKPGAKGRVLVLHNSVNGTFRGRMTIPFSLGSTYAQTEWKTLDIDQAGTGNTLWSYPIYDTGWFDLPDIVGSPDIRAHDFGPTYRIWFDLGGVDKSGVTADGQLQIKLLFDIP